MTIVPGIVDRDEPHDARAQPVSVSSSTTARCAPNGKVIAPVNIADSDERVAAGVRREAVPVDRARRRAHDVEAPTVAVEDHVLGCDLEQVGRDRRARTEQRFAGPTDRGSRELHRT